MLERNVFVRKYDQNDKQEFIQESWRHEYECVVFFVFESRRQILAFFKNVNKENQFLILPSQVQAALQFLNL